MCKYKYTISISTTYVHSCVAVLQILIRSFVYFVFMVITHLLGRVKSVNAVITVSIFGLTLSALTHT